MEYKLITDDIIKAQQNITKSEVVNGMSLFMAICLNKTSITPNPNKTINGKIQRFFSVEDSVFLFSVKKMAKNPTESPNNFNELIVSLKIK